MWRIAQELGYEPLTSFWDDFTIAEHFGNKMIEETAQRIFKYWKENYKYLTEFIMILNHKSWTHNESNPELAAFYVELFYKYYDLAVGALKDDEVAIRYFFQTLD